MDKERRGSEGEAKRRVLMFEQFIKFTHFTCNLLWQNFMKNLKICAEVACVLFSVLAVVS
jgi:hypothetical protein